MQQITLSRRLQPDSTLRSITMSTRGTHSPAGSWSVDRFHLTVDFAVEYMAVTFAGTSFDERRGWDSNPRVTLTTTAGFQDRCVQPLRHPAGRLEDSKERPGAGR